MKKSVRVPLLLSAVIAAILAPEWPRAGIKIAKAQQTVLTAMPSGGLVARPLAASAGDVFNVRDYGALGTNSGTTVAQSGLFTPAQMASLAAMATYANANGAHPLAWMANPLYGLTFKMATSAAQTAVSTSLKFTESGTGQNGGAWSAEALWGDVNHGNYLLTPGMTVTDVGGCIPAGTTLLSYNDDQADAAYGTITLSQATSSPCASGDVVTFSLTSAQIQALTMDYVGAQSAIAAAYTNLASGVGGRVYFPAGTYNISRDLVHPGQSSDTTFEVHDLVFTGDGFTQTHLNATSDFGAAHCLIKEVTRDSGFHSSSTYRDLMMSGALGSTRILGKAPRAMDGLCVGSGVIIEHVNVSGFRAGINIVGNHQNLANINSHDNVYGVYRAPFTLTMGNESIVNSGLVGNTIASWAVAATAQTDSALFENIHTGFGPIGFFCEAPTSNIITAYGGCLTGSTLNAVWIEGIGNSWMYGVGSNASFNNNIITNTGFDGTSSSYKAANYPSNALIQGVNFEDNTLIGDLWANYVFSNAMIMMSSTCQDNIFVNMDAFIISATATNPSLACPVMFRNEFHGFTGMGRFYVAQADLVIGQAVYTPGATVAQAYADGKPFLGVTAAPASANKAVAVYTSGLMVPANKANSNTPFAQGSYVGVTTGGVIPLATQSGAIGVAWNGSGSGNGSVLVSLDAMADRGARGAALNLTAAGTSCTTGFQMSSETNDFTRVASGAAAILPSVSTGQDVMVINDGANPLLVCPNTSMQIGPSGKIGVGVALPAGSSAMFRQVSSTTWRQRSAN